MLETETQVNYVMIAQGRDNLRVIPVDVVSQPQLGLYVNSKDYAVVVAPGVHFSILIKSGEIAAAHVELHDLRVEPDRPEGELHAVLEDSQVLLERSDQPRHSLEVLDESVSGPSAKRPSPLGKVSAIKKHEVLRVVHNHRVHVDIVQLLVQLELPHVLSVIVKAKLSLHIQTSHVHTHFASNGL